MNILLTGANGFLGKTIKEEFSKKHTVYDLSRTVGNYKVFLEKEIPVFKENFEIVIHAAGKAHSVSRNDIEKKEFRDFNIVGTANLLKGLEYCVSLPKQFVFISSVAVYGLDQGELIDENYKLLANDPYGVSKIQAEIIVEEWCKEHNVVCSILRLPLVVGVNPPGNLGSMIKGIEMGYYFNIAGGRAKKSMVLAEDVAKSILQIATVGGVYNLTDGYHPTFLELSTLIAKQLDKNKSKNIQSWIAKLIAYFGDIFGEWVPLNSKKLNKIYSTLTFDDSKAREAFGWKPTRVIDGFNLRKK